MKVLCVGPEASGTRLLARLVSDLTETSAVHRSVPHGTDWWPERGDRDVKAVVVIYRNIAVTMKSQVAAGHMKAWPNLTPSTKYIKSLEVLRDNLSAAPYADVPIARVTYEDLVADPQGTMDRIADQIGVSRQSVSIDVYDGNEKYDE